ncbi:GNAT family N-acetyltransferase [Clostridium cellulovorans]|uniref:GCN5-related N-acetyltransferase n=1 Tax=Clostridium cellulovorans (strain ATCC 35296 / DSM 3052 / OCM 3 / 743B) TaxID=573061 RepID=D9SN57_CLOC7|nr:GNAT family N-acetyltransferase [Clostridium cellulovorans]ADL51923.1 GCN5-related N-acetyltransferase [Clostridium cellulovorans 743B]
MEFRKGNLAEIQEIMRIIRDSIKNMEQNGIYQWDDIYPNEIVIQEDIQGENLYVCISDNKITGFAVLNNYQDREYESISWNTTSDNNLIIHRVCVDPKYQGMGIATKLIQYAEKRGKEEAYDSIRLDSFTKNSIACRLYENNGYEKRGIVKFRKGEFFCFEKKL